jgi:AraC family transcriptional activator of pobA
MATRTLPRPFHQIFNRNQLPIRLIAPGFGHLSAEAAARYGMTHRLSYYFFLFL